MDYKELLAEARKNIGPYCKACNICNGVACKNQIPGPGAKGAGDTAILNYSSWQEIRIIPDPISDVKEVNTNIDFFGFNMKYPLLAGPVGAVKSHYGDLYNDLEYNDILIKGSISSGIIAFCGDGKDPNILKGSATIIKNNNGLAVPTIKPWDLNTIYEKINMLKEANPIAYAMDIDAIGLPFLKNQNPPAGSKTVDELKEIIKRANKPFIVKGILSVKAARKAYEAGASAIVISNHGGRVLDSSVTTSSVLYDIAKEFKGKMKIIVDGGIRSGADVFKALALGADYCMLARPYVVGVYGAKEDGVNIITTKIGEELKDVMLLCGAKTLKDIDITMIQKNGLTNM